MISLRLFHFFNLCLLEVDIVKNNRKSMSETTIVYILHVFSE